MFNIPARLWSLVPIEELRFWFFDPGTYVIHWHKRRSSVNFGGQDIFARICMYEKLIKCAAKTGFQIQSCIPRTHEMKNRILSKNEGCLFFLFPKIYDEVYSPQQAV